MVFALSSPNLNILAYEVLMNPKKKRSYDSKDSFDDSIPSSSDVTSDEEFFTVFEEVFTRNAKWSAAGNVPALGNPSSPWREVERFYNFWCALDEVERKSN